MLLNLPFKRQAQQGIKLYHGSSTAGLKLNDFVTSAAGWAHGYFGSGLYLSPNFQTAAAYARGSGAIYEFLFTGRCFNEEGYEIEVFDSYTARFDVLDFRFRLNDKIYASFDPSERFYESLYVNIVQWCQQAGENGQQLLVDILGEGFKPARWSDIERALQEPTNEDYDSAQKAHILPLYQQLLQWYTEKIKEVQHVDFLIESTDIGAEVESAGYDAVYIEGLANESEFLVFDPQKSLQLIREYPANENWLNHTAAYEAPPRREPGEFPLVGSRKWRDLWIDIENPAGTWRLGRTWKTQMLYDYGEIRGSTGADGDKVDVYLGPNEKAKNVYVVHQNFVGGPRDGQYDEDKVMFGFNSVKEAKEAYLAHYDSPKFFRSITEMPWDAFVKSVRYQCREQRIAEIKGLELPFQTTAVSPLVLREWLVPGAVPDDTFGRAGWLEPDGLHAIHVTSDPDGFRAALERGTWSGASGDLGPGVYGSAIPEVWMGRATKKWDFLQHVEQDPNARNRLANALMQAVERRRLTENEVTRAQRDIEGFRQGQGYIVYLAGQPYNIPFWTPEFLKPLDIVAGPTPAQIELLGSGTFAELSRNPTIEEGTALASKYDGAFVHGGWSTTAQIVFYRPSAVQIVG